VYGIAAGTAGAFGPGTAGTVWGAYADVTVMGEGNAGIVGSLNG